MVATGTLLRDVIFFVKDILEDNVTDPLGSRPANEKFVMTAYPQRSTRFPIITIKDLNLSDGGALGLQSEAHLITIELEVRVWGRNVKERDEIFTEVYQTLKDNQIGSVGTSQANDLHDFQLLSAVNVDEPDGPKSKVLSIKYIFVAT